MKVGNDVSQFMRRQTTQKLIQDEQSSPFFARKKSYMMGDNNRKENMGAEKEKQISQSMADIMEGDEPNYTINESFNPNGGNL
eukprot:CAMPEP_0170493766 /NCGR_PEP_ID=MMETSP0208-20121228/14255_1 /TAXON_ID=197538 /ORGANISM="Strombidium inclinatum, Strain S3" /LENGTH=82 /DNA_ID=CAMNT_0010769727 /DNA_START=1961 /DNA_END=2209 /DNA_ORIENTATION=-